MRNTIIGASEDFSFRIVYLLDEVKQDIIGVKDRKSVYFASKELYMGSHCISRIQPQDTKWSGITWLFPVIFSCSPERSADHRKRHARALPGSGKMSTL